MDISIIVVNYNTINLVIDSIDSILQKTIGITYEIIIVDNNSSDNSEKILYQKYQNSIIFIPLMENIGFGRANNEGIKISKGRNILFLNPDTLLINNAIKILSDYLDTHAEVGACGGNLYDENLEPTISYEMNFPSIFYEIDFYCGRILSCLFYGKNSKFNFTENIKSVAYISGADLMIRKKDLDVVGFFNDKFFMYYEETELCFRIKKNGFQLKNIPQARIQHLEGKSFGTSVININKLKIQEKSRNVFYSLCYSKFYTFIASKIRYLLILLRFNIAKFFKGNYKYWHALLCVLKYK